MILYGPSGIGKSSVLQAGVVPNLRTKRRNIVVYFSDWQRDNPIGRLRNVCLGAVNSAPEPPPIKHQEKTSNADAIEKDDEAPLELDPSTIDQIGCTEKGTLFLVLDQFEDYLLHEPTNEYDWTFDAELARAVNREDVKIHVLIGIREEDLSKLDRLKTRIPSLLGTMLRLPFLSEPGLERALRGPIDTYNAIAAPDAIVHFGEGEDDPVVAVLSQLREKGSAPELSLLQIVMARLWEEETRIWNRTKRLHLRTLRRSTLEISLGGVQGIVDGYLEDVMSGLPKEQREMAARVFRELVNSKGDRVARFVEQLLLPTRHSRPELDELLGILEDQRIVRRIPPDSCEIRPALARSALAWRTRYRTRQRKRRLHVWIAAVTLLVVSGVVAWGIALSNGSRAAIDNAKSTYNWNLAGSTILALEAELALTKDPELSLTLARYSIQKKDAEQGRNILYRASDLVFSRPNGTLYDFEDPQRVTAGGGEPSHTLYTASFSPDGKVIAAASEKNRVRVWDVASGRFVRDLRHTAALNSAVFSRQGDFIAAASDDNTALIWKWPAGELKKWSVGGVTRASLGNPKGARVTDGHIDQVWGVAVSPNGAYVATASADHTAKVWNVRSGQCFLTIPHSAAVVSVAFNPGGDLIATSGLDNIARIWDIHTGKLIQELNGHSYYIYGLAFSPNGLWLATASWDGTARVWDAHTGRSVFTFRTDADRLWGVAFNPKGTWLAAATRSGQAKIWDLRSGGEVLSISAAASQLTGLSFSPDGQILAAGTNESYVKLWDSFPESLGQPGRLTSASFNGQGQRILTGATDGKARLWDTASATEKADMTSSSNVTAVAFSPNSAFEATGDESGVVSIWNDSGHRIKTLKMSDDRIATLAFDPTGGRLAVGGWDSTLRLWNWNLAKSGQNPITTTWGQRIMALAFSFDGKSLAVGGDPGGSPQSLAIWRVSNLTAQPQTYPSCPEIYAIAFSPDGKRIAVGCADASAQIRELGSGKLIPINGHQSSIYDIRFDNEGGRVATASADGTAKVWDSQTGSLLNTTSGHSGGVFGVFFNGRDELSSIGIDQTIRQYELKLEAVLQRAARRGRRLTPEECKKYFIDKVCPPH